MFNTYLITCLINGKVYVGQETGGKGSRWKEHIKGAFKQNRQEPLYRAMRKHGLENFVRKTLTFHRTQQALDNKERKLIKSYHSLDRHFGYNLTEGGRGGGGYHFNLSEEAKRKISRGNKGKKRTKEQRRHISEAQKGKRLSKEHRLNIGLGVRKYYNKKTKKERKRPFTSNKAKRSLSRALKGRTLSRSHCRNIAKARKKWWSKQNKKARKRHGRKVGKALKGRILSRSHRLHISEVKYTDKRRENISKSLTGKKRKPFSKEWRLHMSQARKRYFARLKRLGLR